MKQLILAFLLVSLLPTALLRQAGGRTRISIGVTETMDTFNLTPTAFL
jgi:hypothetical protein